MDIVSFVVSPSLVLDKTQMPCLNLLQQVPCFRTKSSSVGIIGAGQIVSVKQSAFGGISSLQSQQRIVESGRHAVQCFLGEPSTSGRPFVPCAMLQREKESTRQGLPSLDQSTKVSLVFIKNILCVQKIQPRP